MAKKTILTNNYEIEMESIIAAIYLFKTHGDYSKENMATYMLECGVPKKRVADYTNLSRRKIDQCVERAITDEQ